LVKALCMREVSPAVIIHGLPDARAALAPGRPVTLLSARHAAGYAGCLWWCRVLQASGFTGTALLDCGTAPGRALEALKLGLRGVVLSCEPPAYAVIAELAAAQGALLLPVPPPALDLAQRGAARRLEGWLTPTPDDFARGIG
jgi:hypothetical protein